jgi:hypothetical protein
MANLIRSANGKMIDMDQLRIKNEREIALGNMGVNARGDVVNKKKEVVVTRAQRLKEHYQLHSPVPTKEPYRKTSTETEPVKQEAVAEPVVSKPDPFTEYLTTRQTRKE